MADTIADTRRLFTKPQNLNDAYGPPSNFLEIDVGNPETIGVGRGRFTTYEIRLKVSVQLKIAQLSLLTPPPAFVFFKVTEMAFGKNRLTVRSKLYQPHRY